MSHEERKKLDRDGDNAWFVIDQWLHIVRLGPADKKIIREAYAKGYEQISDGETAVPDMFHGIKSPAGVTHDYINRVKDHQTDDGHIWTKWEANALYRRIKKRSGSSWTLRWRRWLAVTVTSYWWK